MVVGGRGPVGRGGAGWWGRWDHDETQGDAVIACFVAYMDWSRGSRVYHWGLGIPV